jgi:hypothetical protein
MNMNTVQAIIHDDILTNSRLAKFEDYEMPDLEEFLERYNCTEQELKDYIEQMNNYALEGSIYDSEGNLLAMSDAEIYDDIKASQIARIEEAAFYSQMGSSKHLEVELFICEYKSNIVLVESTEFAEFAVDIYSYPKTQHGKSQAHYKMKELKEKWDKEYTEKV